LDISRSHALFSYRPALVVVCGAVPGAASFSIAVFLMAAALVLSCAIVIVYSCVMCMTKCRRTGQTRDTGADTGSGRGD